MTENNAIVEEEDTVEDDEDNDVDSDHNEADSAIQARAAQMFASLNK